MNSEEIKKLIPHREPFLLLDEIIECAENGLSARFTIKPESPLFAAIYPGHYPSNPVTPGVILCEIVFQAGAVFMARRLADAATVGVPVITRIRDARFKNVVRPGAELEITVEFEDQVSNAYYLKGGISCGGKPVLKVAFTCALAQIWD